MALVNLAQATFNRAALQADCDDAIFTTHWQGSGSLTNADRVLATNKLKTFVTDLAAFVSNKYVFKEVRWYEVEDGGEHKAKFVETIPVNYTPTATAGALPPQCALSVTLRTTGRKQWGRFYLPGLTVGALDTNGYVSQSLCDNACTAAQKLTDDATLPHVIIWSPTLSAVAGVTQVVVDNVPDVIRRRRFNVATYRKIISAP